MIIKSKFLNNASWIVAGRIIQMIISLFVSVLTARYLGPSNYGILAYTASFVAFFTSISTLGLNNILVKEVIDAPQDEGMIIGTTIILRMISSAVCMTCICFLVYILNKDEPLYVYVVFLQAFGMFFQAFEMITYWYQSRLQSKTTAIITLVGYIITSIYKIILLVLSKDVIWFAFANTLDYIIIAAFLYYCYKRDGSQKFSFSLEKGKQMLSKSYHFILSGLMVAIYGQMDKIMIGQMLDTESVGYYSTAVAICAMWTFILVAIIDSARPIIMALKHTDEKMYEKRIIQLYSAVIWISFFVSMMFQIFGGLVIGVLYGEAYLSAITPLKIVTWYTAFSYLGVAKNIWMISENKQRYAKVLCGAGAISNLILNFILIPVWGINGAAIASLLTQIVTNVITPLIIKDMRPIFYHTMKAFNIKYLYLEINNIVKRRQDNNVH